MKGQMKIQEMAFVLLALVLLAMIGFIFFLRLSQQKLIESAETAKEKTTISLLEKIASMPELECYRKAACVDEMKAKMLNNQLFLNPGLQNMFQGLNNVSIKRVYPPGGFIPIYSKGKANSTYSTFINLCQYKQIGSSSSFSYDCDVAMLIAG